VLLAVSIATMYTSASMAIDRNGWQRVLLVLAPTVIAFLLVNHHYRSQTLLGAEATRAMMQDVIYDYAPAAYARYTRQSSIAPAAGDYQVLIKSTTVKGRGAFRIGRVEIVLTIRGKTFSSVVRFFRADDTPDYGWIISWDENPLSYYLRY
jgi:hypothetical protein